MDNIDKYNNYYNKSNDIVKLYDSLVNILISKGKKNYNDIKLILDKIKSEINIEYRTYDNILLDDIDDMIKIIHLKDGKELKFADIRVNSRLAILYDKLCGNTVLNLDIVSNIDENLNFSLVDLVTSKIVIDVYKLLDSKLDSINVSDNKSLSYFNSIRTLNTEYMVYKLSLNEVSERLGLEYGYDIKRIPIISINDIEKNIFETHGLNINLGNDLNSKVFKYLLSKINEFKEMNIDMDNYESIYDNLLYVSIFEVLITYLNNNQLEFLMAYFNRFNSDNKIVLSNIKKLVRSKINGL